LLTKLLQSRTEDLGLRTELKPAAAAKGAAATALGVVREISTTPTSPACCTTWSEKHAANVEQVPVAQRRPVINRVSAGYPKDFTDMGYPKGVATSTSARRAWRTRRLRRPRARGQHVAEVPRGRHRHLLAHPRRRRAATDCFVRFEDGHTTFKRVFFEKDEAGRDVLRLQPRNEKYRAQTIAAENVSGLYKAVFKYQRVDED
jgi:hypothetical protein